MMLKLPAEVVHAPPYFVNPFVKDMATLHSMHTVMMVAPEVLNINRSLNELRDSSQSEGKNQSISEDFS